MDNRWLIERRITNFELLLLENPTPLLRQQMRHAITLHYEALQHSDLNPFLNDLNTLHDKIREHWTKLYRDLVSRTSLLHDLILFQHFLIAKSLEDYANKPWTVSEWVLSQAKCVIEQEGDTRARDSTYQVHVVYPLEEMIINRDHVENKLRAIPIRQEHSNSDIRPLIDRCDWSSLATALTSDRDLTLKLFEIFKGQPADANVFTVETCKEILEGIDKIQGKYFADLLDSSTFTISTHAKKLSAGQASNSNHKSSLMFPTFAPANTRQSPDVGLAWNIYNTFASGLRWSKPSLTPHSISDADETASLINLKKTD